MLFFVQDFKLKTHLFFSTAMNLHEDFINIQGILLSLEKSSSPLKKIKHRGGNEDTILNLVTELHKFLSSKKYIKNEEINPAFNQQLQNICMFLILNTELKTPLDTPEFLHLINIAPQLSTCLLANVIFGLDLSIQYCQALVQFDLSVIEELLREMIPCLKKCKPRVHIANAFEFLKLIITKLETSSDSDGIDKLSDIASQMLLNLTGIHGDQIDKVKIDSVYQCMGFTLLSLLDLLLMCNQKKSSLSRIIEKLIKTSCSIKKAVTLDVFCCWAEVEHENEVLQTLIAGKSYLFIEKYQKYLPAKELITDLGIIAQKPKTINEQIHSADVPTMISMINKADLNQKHWFTALLNTQVLKCQDSIKCVDRWTHLCTIGDVSRLLNLSVTTKDSAAKNVVVKCAAALEFEELILVTTRHFHQNGITNNLTENIQQQLILLFNKIRDKNIGDEFCKELYLLLLQNPEQMLTYTFGECCKNTFYSQNLANFWPSIKEIVTISDFGVKILQNEMKTNTPNEHNCKNYIALLNTLIQSNIFTCEYIIRFLILPLLQESLSINNQVTKYSLEILKDLEGRVSLKEEIEPLYDFLFDLMKKCRCNFMNFDGLRQEIVKLCVDIIEKYSEMNKHISYEGHGIKSEDFFVTFYAKKLYEESCESNLFTHFFPINFDNHAETVAHLIKILPLCVTPEWIMISSHLVTSCGIEKTIELLCDSLILLCELVKSQETKTEEVKSMFLGLGYCLQNLAIVIKECLQPTARNLKEEVTLTRNVCRLLREIPSGNLKSEEGLSLASLLSDASLKSLRPDKKFACLVASIHESHICKMLAQKILS